MSLLNRLFNKNPSSDANRSLRRLKRNASKSRSDSDLRLQVEKLEEKIALAAQAFSAPSTEALGGGSHVIVLDSNLDDVYIRVTQTTSDEGLGPDVVEQIQFDTDPNFTAPTSLEHISTLFQDLFVTSGVRNSVAENDIQTSGNGGLFVSLDTALDAGVTPPSTASSLNAVVPGTLSGSIIMPDARGVDIVEFRTETLQDSTLLQPLVFSVNNGAWASSVDVTHTIITPGTGTGGPTLTDKTIAVDGTLVSGSDNLIIDFSTGDNFQLNAPVSLNANYASPIIPEGPSTVRLAPGLDFDMGFLVDLPGENSKIEISSPILQAGTPNMVSLAATEIAVNATIDSGTGFFATGTTGTVNGTFVQDGLGGNWRGGAGGDTEVEQVVFTAPVTAPEFGFVIKDDQQTSVRSRGKLYVSSTGSLTGATQISVDTTHADIIFEGTVDGTTQSYMFRTRTESTPYQFVTNQGVGFPVGSIAGDTVDITLSNEDPVSASDSVTHNIDLNTDVGSLRIAAAGDDSFGRNSTGVVAPVGGLVGNPGVGGIIESNEVTLGVPSAGTLWSDVIQEGDVVLGNASDGIVPTPQIVQGGVVPDSPLDADRLGPGTVQLASPVNLAAGSQVSFQTSATFIGNVLAVVNAGAVESGQTVLVNGVEVGRVVESLGTFDLDDDPFSPEDAAVAVSYQPPLDGFGNPTIVPVTDDLISFQATSFSREVVPPDLIPPLQITIPVTSVQGIAVGMNVSGAGGLSGTVAAIDRNPFNPTVLVNTTDGVGLNEELTFSYTTALSQDYDASLAVVDDRAGVAYGMTATGVDSLGASVNNTVVSLNVTDSDTLENQEELLLGRIVDFTDPVVFEQNETISFESPASTVVTAVAGGEEVALGSLVGIADGATVNIAVADMPNNVVVLSIDDDNNTIFLSENVLSGDSGDPADADKGVLVVGSTISFGRAQRNEFFRYGISVDELNDLELDATVSSGGPISIEAAGNLDLNASLRSHGNVSLESSSGAVTGNAWLVTRDGSISISGQQVNLSGDTQVLASPFDESITDIEIVANAGGVTLGGNLSAVNRVSIEQRGTGNVDVTGVAFASDMQVFSEGAVSLATSVGTLDVTAEGDVTVSEDDHASISVDTASAGRVTLSAGGVDPASGDAALTASVRGTTNVVVSAPRGSVAVTSLSSEELVVGEADLLLAGQSTEMFAAGNVSIRSGQESVRVLDAPTAGRGVLTARAVATGDIVGDFSINNPGVTPSTLRAQRDPISNALIDTNNFNTAIDSDVPGFEAGGLTFRVRDTILLTGQSVAAENGLYQIMSLGGIGTNGWELRRVPLADTTAEFPVNSRVRVSDGDETTQGSVWRVSDYDNQAVALPLSVTTGRERAVDEVTVNFATDQALEGSYNPGLIDEINGTSAGLVIDGVGLSTNDLLLVRHGVVDEQVSGADDWTNELSLPSNGIYRYTQGDPEVPGDTWVLQKLLPEPGVELVSTIVVVSEGRYNTAVTGETFVLAYDGLGFSNITIEQDNVSSSIGSFDPRDTTTFVVTTAGGTNDAAGSLGKMLSLVQDNQATDLTGELLEQKIEFNDILGDIRGPTNQIVLRQELPVVAKPFVLEASGIFVDGTRITSTRGGAFVTSDTVVNGLEYREGAGTSLLVNGMPIPEEATRGELRGLAFAGFDQGGAVVVDGASNLLIEGVSVGVDGGGATQASKYGIQVTGDSGQNGPVTLLRNTVVGSNLITGNFQNPLAGAGVQIDGSAQGVQLVGGTIGNAANGSNFVGVVVESDNDNTTRANSIGVNPIPADYSVLLSTVANEATLTIPDDIWQVIGDDLYIGQGVQGSGIASVDADNIPTKIIHIDPANRSVVLSTRMTETASDVSISFVPGVNNDRTLISENFYGVDLRSGSSRVNNTSINGNVISGIRVGVDPTEDSDGDGVNDVQTALWAQIGSGIALDDSGVPSSTIRSNASNAIFGPGSDPTERQRYGIQFRNAITGMTTSNGITTDIQIQGNYLGTNTSAAPNFENGRFDYWWDASQTGSNDEPPVDPGTGVVDAAFESLITAPDSESPGEDENGNLSAELGGEDGLIDGGSGTGDSGGNDGIVHTPIRR